MNHSVILTRIDIRPLLTLCVVVLGLVAILPATPAHAFESRAFGDVTVEPGEAEGEVFTAFGDVTVNGAVPGDVHSAFGDVTVNRSIEGSVNAGLGDITVRAPVAGEVDAGFGDVNLYSSVGGDVDVEHGEVYLDQGASVAGDLKCGNCEIEGNEDAVVGTIDTRGMDFDGPSGRDILGFVGWILASALFVACSVLAAVLVPRPLLAAARRAEEAPGRSFLFGLASVPAAIVLSVVLLISVVGAPLLLLLAPAYLALVFFGALVAAFFVGSKLMMVTGRYRAGNALAAVVGALILSALTLIPLVGDLLLYALALLGTGAAILVLFSRRRSFATHPSYEAYVRDRAGG
jgi:cytoskeletal protein CcmA (bactofilin family)